MTLITLAILNVPNCNGRVYHINEDDYIVYCTSIGCQWHDRSCYPKGVKYADVERNCKKTYLVDAFDSGACIHLKRNAKYPSCSHPVIIMSDACNYKYRIRNFDFDSGHSFFDGGYDKATYVYASYRTLDDLIDDGWEVD